MDILDRYLGYETWTLRYFILRCREITEGQLHQKFDIGPGTVHETLIHIIGNLEVWTDLMRERPVRQNLPAPNTIDDCLQRFDVAMIDLADCAQSLVSANRLDDTYVDILDNPPTTKTFGGTLLHILTHTTVHRWEIQHMLQRLGVPDLIEGDALSWEWRLRHKEL